MDTNEHINSSGPLDYDAKPWKVSMEVSFAFKVHLQFSINLTVCKITNAEYIIFTFQRLRLVGFLFGKN